MTKVVVVLILTTVVLAFPPRQTPHLPPRWSQPCGPPSGVRLHRFDITRLLLDFVSRMEELQSFARNLMTKYVDTRFKCSQSEADELLPIEGCSDGHPPMEFRVTYHSAFEQLARMAVFVNVSREEEKGATSSFTDDYYNLEFNGNGGIYASLCLLQSFIIHSGEELSPGMLERVGAIRVCSVPNNAQRHQRDYIFLRRLDQLTSVLATAFQELAEQS